MAGGGERMDERSASLYVSILKGRRLVYAHTKNMFPFHTCFTYFLSHTLVPLAKLAEKVRNCIELFLYNDVYNNFRTI